jgi:hypothetical protein
MARRYPNPRLVKLHRSYTVEEVATRLGVHKNTVRHWLRQGLSAIDGNRPIVILGQSLAAFLQTRRQANKQKCAPAEIFCVRCRIPVIPAGGMVDYLPITVTSGNLRGICPRCETLIHRRASLVRAKSLNGILDVVMPQAETRIREGLTPSVNCDSDPLEQAHG